MAWLHSYRWRRIIWNWRGLILNMQEYQHKTSKYPRIYRKAWTDCATKAPLSDTWMYQVDKVNECLDNSLRKTSSSRASSRYSPMRLVERFRICHPGRTCNQIWRCPVCRKYLWNMQHIQLNTAATKASRDKSSFNYTVSFSLRLLISSN